MVVMSQSQETRRFEHSACSECGSHVSVDEREMSVDDDELRFEVSCESCDATGTIVIDSDGTSTQGSVDYHFASESPFAGAKDE